MHLAETDIPIESIALNVGYTNPSYFTRRFKQLNKCSPSDYRLSYQQAVFSKSEARED
ncbi:MAG TPA: helix-turn-helix transcriptional regulator [Firmicutes bacterium]|nr:helix-turn-helix transcriptional regulator [Bacillota bacterium]